APCASSCRTAVPDSVTLLSRTHVVPCKAAADLVKGRAWPDTEGVTGSNPVAPTNRPLTSGNSAGPFSSDWRRGQESTAPFGKCSAELGSLRRRSTLSPALSALSAGALHSTQRPES